MKPTDSGGGREYAVMTESLGHIIVRRPGKPLQWVPKNRARDIERHYIRLAAQDRRTIDRLTRQLRAMKAHRKGTDD
jgi:hypothetical protein